MKPIIHSFKRIKQCEKIIPSISFYFLLLDIKLIKSDTDFLKVKHFHPPTHCKLPRSQWPSASQLTSVSATPFVLFPVTLYKVEHENVNFSPYLVLAGVRKLAPRMVPGLPQSITTK